MTKAQQIRGKLELWQTFDGPNQIEIPDFETISKRPRPEDFVVDNTFGASVDLAKPNGEEL